jgi:hypothetical protein
MIIKRFMLNLIALVYGFFGFYGVVDDMEEIPLFVVITAFVIALLILGAVALGVILYFTG